jgi:hypothetical protein
MSKSARRYDVYLPLTYNDGRPVEDDKFDAVERRLLAQFGGLTAQQRDFPLRGIWQGQTRLYFDEVILMTVLDFRRRGSARFLKLFKSDLLQQFDQLEILITEAPLRVH